MEPPFRYDVDRMFGSSALPALALALVQRQEPSQRISVALGAEYKAVYRKTGASPLRTALLVLLAHNEKVWRTVFRAGIPARMDFETFLSWVAPPVKPTQKPATRGRVKKRRVSPAPQSP